MKLSYHSLSPNKAYRWANLYLPKTGINEHLVKSALSFSYGEEDTYDDDTGAVIGSKQKMLELWQETSNHLIVPREFVPPGQEQHFDFEFVKPSYSFPAADIREHIELRDQAQQDSFDALQKHPSGTLNVACGHGKSVLALKLAGTLKVPTMIVVNTTALIEQWAEEIQRHLTVPSVGWVQGTRLDWQHPIVLSTVHTLSQHREKWGPDFRQHFGLVFYDEGHHMSAPVFARSADLFLGRRYSLTATAQRTDGLEAIYQYHLGKVIHSNLSQALIPTTFFHKLKWALPIGDMHLIQDVSGAVNLPKLRGYLGSLDHRNQIIYRWLLKDLKEGRNILVLSHSVAHVETLLAGGPATGKAITGATAQAQRMALLAEGNPVYGTFQLAREGLNRPNLDTLYITTPFSNANDLQQSWGRIQRLHGGKKAPIVRVFEDSDVKRCRKSCLALQRHLRALDYPIKSVKEIP
jgi:superfamily II DNA or RNA helicase